MVTCPWCGTSYEQFQPTCSKCGGSLPLPVEESAPAEQANLRVPPPAPRDLPRNYVWRILGADAGAIVGGILGFVGLVFVMVGVPLTLSLATIFVSLPFVLLGLVLLVAGSILFILRYREAQATVEVLREGEPVLGTIEQVYQNLQVQVNGRNPWTIVYRFEALGKSHEGRVTTLSQPSLNQEPGKPVYVLIEPGNPARNTIYPHPYGYYGL